MVEINAIVYNAPLLILLFITSVPICFLQFFVVSLFPDESTIIDIGCITSKYSLTLFIPLSAAISVGSALFTSSHSCVITENPRY